MTQRWRWLTFLHWGYEPHVIQHLLPPNLRVDTFNGQAWVGLVPFVISDLRWRSLPPIPWISGFPETNVRTYVKAPDGKSGVWFFTLEADRLLAVLGARLTYRLPYRWASMKVSRTPDQVCYRSRRLPPFGAGRTDVTIEPCDPISPIEFDHFLTARFRLYTAVQERIGYAEIEHNPWPLASARVIHLEQDLIERSGIPSPSGDPVVHYSEDLTVRVDRLRWLGK